MAAVYPFLGKPKPTFISLFAGIGGIDLGLERAGWQCAAQVEIDPYCRRVLAKHWPNVPQFEDVRTFGREQFDGAVDLIAGGFPCTNISNAGDKVGIDGEHSGLWSEFARIVRVFRPLRILLENVSAILVRGIDRVLGDLAACGFDAEWDCLPLTAFGAPHGRDRWFCVGYPHRVGQSQSVYPKQLRASGGNTENDSPFGPVRFAWPPGPGEVDRIPRMADGLPRQLVRTGRKQSHTALGNAVSPIAAEWIGRRIRAEMEASCA